MNLLESSLIKNKLLYKIYYQNNFFFFNKCIGFPIMVFENKSLYLYIIIFNNELISIFTKDIVLKIY